MAKHGSQHGRWFVFLNEMVMVSIQTSMLNRQFPVIISSYVRMNLPLARKRLGLRQPSGAFDQQPPVKKRQRAGAVQNQPVLCTGL
jgi:hypothetical protein